MNILIEVLISIGIGGLVGLEREWRRKLVGIGTFMIISLLGYLSFNAITVSPFIVPLALLSVVLLSVKQKDYLEGSTFVASLVVFLLGGMVAMNNAAYAASIALIIMALLAMKDTLHHFAYSFTEKEIRDIVKMGALVLVIMPLLPKHAIDPWGLFNPFNMWLMLVAILGLSFMAYMLVKFLGGRAGIILTAVLGGFASSTALTFQMMEVDWKTKGGLAGAAAFLGSTTMFIKALALLMLFNPLLTARVAPRFLMVFFLGLVVALWLFRGKKTGQADQVTISNPMDFKFALKFVGFFMAVTVGVYLARVYLGVLGAYTAAFLGGFTDIDAVALSAVNLLAGGTVRLETAAIMVCLAGFANTLTKGCLMIWRGKKENGTKWMGLLLIGLASLLFLPI
ncbi:MAG TPA: MgtC/SapB family protein [archaeon]|nr:MgtC/SapB family protein [archaeon]